MSFWSHNSCGKWKGCAIIVKVTHLCTIYFVNCIPIFPPIAQRTPSIITSSCWKSTVSDLTPCCIYRKKEACSERHRFVCPVNQKWIWVKNNGDLIITYKTNTIVFDVEIIINTSTYSFVLLSYKFLIVRATAQVTFWTRPFCRSRKNWNVVHEVFRAQMNYSYYKL